MRFHPWTKLKDTIITESNHERFCQKIFLKNERQGWEHYFVRITRYHYRYLESNEALLFCNVKIKY